MTQRRSRNLGPNHKRAKSKRLTSQETTQFALEQAIKKISALEKQFDGLAKLDKQREIQANKDRIANRDLDRRVENFCRSVKSLETRVYRSDSE